MSAATGVRPVITAWGAISSFGIGATAFRNGVTGGTPSETTVSDGDTPPGTEVRLIEPFEVRDVLGPKKTRSMDRLTALTVAAVGEVVGADGAGQDPALVLGTTTGSVQSMMDFTRGSLTAERPYLVDPARFPNTVMNCAAGRAAIWHHLTGPNATIGGGRAAGVLALNYARRLQASGRAETVLCGAAEEYSRDRAWVHHHARGDTAPGVLGEGCAVVRLAPGGDGLADLLAVELGVFTAPQDVPAVLDGCVRTALDRAGLAPRDVWAVAPSGIAGVLGEAENDALDVVLAGTERLRCAELIGDTAAAAALFQLLTVLATAEAEPSARTRAALVTTVDWDGVVGAAVVAVRPNRSHRDR